MNIPHFKLIKEQGKHRLYECEKELRFGIIDEGNESRELERGTLSRTEKEGLTQSLFNTVKQPTKYFVVSDARTHTERLVFPVYVPEQITEIKVTSDEIGLYFLGCYCAGEMTMMIDGGDYSTIRDDCEYLAELWERNTKECEYPCHPF